MIGQRRLHSVYETITSTAVGYLLSFACQQWIIAPLFNLRTDVMENILIVAIFTIISLLRGYGVRRFFNWWHIRTTSYPQLYIANEK